jgi:hypothetical protein
MELAICRLKWELRFSANRGGAWNDMHYVEMLGLLPDAGLLQLYQLIIFHFHGEQSWLG